MMKRKEHEKGSLEPIPLKTKMVTHHQKEVFCEESKDNGVGSGDKSPGKLLNVLLPYDMEVETLSRLPGKSLMKFLCVSKNWYSLIRSQRFVASYYAAKPSRFIAAFTNSVFGKPERLFIMSGEEEEEGTSSLVANLDMTIPSVTLPHGSAKFSSVHGFLACFELSKFIICNPSTGQVITFHCKAPGTSLGYDPVDDQFKALTQVTSVYDHNPSSMVHEVITLGRGGVVSRTQVTSPPHHPLTMGRCINGFIYYAAWAPVYGATPVFVCFDVRHERILSFITTPKEDVTKHEWSKQTFELPLSLPFTLGAGDRMISQGTNKAGEIIFSPTTLTGRAQPFYVFYFNPDTKNMTRVRIHGVADTEDQLLYSAVSVYANCCLHHLFFIVTEQPEPAAAVSVDCLFCWWVWGGMSKLEAKCIVLAFGFPEAEYPGDDIPGAGAGAVTTKLSQGVTREAPETIIRDGRRNYNRHSCLTS
ncbi:hypothetical protein DY000_02038472 [Brassica cretica]|uniref:F-box domain-containing protein n=1 Tax=Brassica cretica TaxID=69181 RepID=A0ABQ7B6J5_BRACR|nr:hypothetical protein DY000_02038472 [Brassica cretica]